MFNPARRRLQAAVDRRFDRARYDAARAVEAFAARLRDQVDLDEVTAGLRETVVATVAPTRVAVWLRVPSGTGGTAVTRRADLRRAAPWVLCAVSLGLLALGVLLRWLCARPGR